MSDFAPSVSAGSGLDPRKRVNYQVGLVLGEDEFRQDQLYFRARDHLATRALHGYGTVAGLAVSFDEPSGELRVQPGLAVDAMGRIICVPVEYCAQLNSWLTNQLDDALAELPGNVGAVPGPHDLYVVLCYAECATDEVPVPSESCLTAEDSRAASRLMESFELKIVAVEPEPVNELADDEIAAAVDALMGFLDPDAPDPPDFDDVAGVVRQWAVERRPEIAAGAACLDGSEVCVPLATVTLSVAESPGGNRQPDGAVAVDDADRPIVLSTRFLQEALLRAAPAEHEHTVEELTDTNLSGVRNGDVMWFHAASGLWRPRRFNHTHNHSHGLDDLRDVALDDPAPDAGNVLTFDGEEWRPAEPAGGGGGSHGGLTDLGADDHAQYLPRNGARPMAGSLDLDGNRIVNVPASAGSNQPIVQAQPAAGDLGATYPAPTVTGIQGSPVDGGAEDRDGLLFAGGRWAPGVPTMLPFATIRYVGSLLEGFTTFEVWLHLEVGRLDGHVDELDPGTFLVLAELSSGTAVDPVPVDVRMVSTVQRNVFLVGIDDTALDPQPTYLRWEFRMEQLLINTRQRVRSTEVPLLEWARQARVWFFGQGIGFEEDLVVTAYCVNEQAAPQSPPR